MRSFLIITLLAAGAHFATVQADDVDELRLKLRGDPDHAPEGELAEGEEAPERVDSEADFEHESGAPIIAIEIDENGKYVIPTEPSDDDFDVIELAQFSKATHLDAAGVQRSAAGRPIDAEPGSLDAALTGMQHDAAGTVRNTVSPEPTESHIVADALARDPALEEQPAPKAAQATTR